MAQARSSSEIVRAMRGSGGDGMWESGCGGGGGGDLEVGLPGFSHLYSQ